MNRKSHDFLFLVLAIPVLTLPASAKELERLEWSRVTGATHYVGTVTAGGNTYLISTTSTWILTEKGTVKRIDARRGNNSLQTGISVRKVAFSGPSSAHTSEVEEPTETPTAVESATLEPNAVPDLELEPESAAAEGAIGTDSEAAPVEIETNSTENVPTTVNDSPAEEKSTFTFNSRAGVSIGMGRQWLKSEAGISEFSGGANIGGTILTGSYTSGKSQFWFDGEFSAHNFATETSKTGATTDSKSEEKNTQMRARVSVFYNFIQRVSSPLQGLSAGGGLQYLKHPLLVIDNDQTGGAIMKTESALALNLGVRYGKLLSRKNLFATGADATPASFGKDVKTLSTSVSIAWLHLITPRIYTNLGVVSGREKITSTGQCPTVSNCKEDGLTKSDVLQIRMGLELGF